MKTQMLTLLATTAISAQNIDTAITPITWQWEGLHAIKLSATGTLQSEIADSKAMTAHSQIDLYAQVPIIRKDDNYFGSGIVYRMVIPQLDIVPPFALLDSKAYMGQIIVAWWHKLSKTASLYSEYNGGISGLWSSPTESQSHLAFSYAGFKPKANRFYRAGIAVAYQFGELALYPLLGANIGITDDFALDCMFPTHVAARFKLNERMELGAKGSYAVGGIGFQTTAETPINYGWSYFSGGIYSDFRIYNNIIFRIEGGEQFLRKIELKTMEGDSLLTLKPKPTPFASLSIRWQV